MRICLIGDGSSEHIMRLSSYLVDQGNDVHLITWKTRPGFPSRVKLHILTNHRIPLFRELGWILGARRCVKSVKPNIIDAHYVTIYGFLAALTNFHPLVVTGWGSDILVQPYRNLLWRSFARYTLHNADRINLLFTKQVAFKQMKLLGIDQSKIQEVLLGVDTRMFKREPDGKRTASFFGLDPERPIIANVRGLAPIYDVQTYFRAAAIVLKTCPDAQFVTLHRPGQRVEAEALSDKHDLNGHMTLLDWLPHDQMPKFLSTADIYVSTSLSDGASNSLLEAMSCEKASVVTDIPANRQWIADGDNGYLFPPGDAQSLAKKIISLINDPNRRLLFGRRSRDIAQSRAECQGQMEQIVAGYCEVIREYQH
ncbi:Glycosyltransferase involved in cell wall bisynthesis [Dehalogenimonas formicexedens]|uniref:Glycosyltransferase involved in cell wall bisynthesis n=1 Tax=Dehalogenimonas formicexedens TaxID=1839801 RepID=A0A1P8F9K7_9CHLR|nr:glycosyltransferase family 4 protein [Dehalogenimonas formicexedens]APV45146.1 Glycosyltransferase involved in cell wall bisynthesis [Dehalogenimonas formicexedens]